MLRKSYYFRIKNQDENPLNYKCSLKNSRLKIAVLGTRGFPRVQGGVEAHCEHLYPRLAGKGCEVIVFTRKPYVDLNITEYKGVTLIPLPCLKNKFFEAFLHTLIGIFAAKKFSPDILHIHAIGPSLFIPVARLLGLKVIMTNHGPDYLRKKWGTLAKTVLKLGEKAGSKWANSIVCISETIAEQVKNKYERTVTVIPNGVTIPEIIQSNTTLEKYGLITGKYILSVGRIVPEKGFHDLIDAFNRLITYDSNLKVDNWKLVIIGKADHEDKYSLGLKEKASLNSNIILTGFLTGEPLQELYSHAGLFALPSYYEGLPIVLLEALSYGLSCIASDIPANREVGMEDDRYFCAGDTEALVSKIKEFVHKAMNDEEKMSQRNRIAEKYDWEKIADKTLEVYTSVQ